MKASARLDAFKLFLKRIALRRLAAVGADMLHAHLAEPTERRGILFGLNEFDVVAMPARICVAGDFAPVRMCPFCGAAWIAHRSLFLKLYIAIRLRRVGCRWRVDMQSVERRCGDHKLAAGRRDPTERSALVERERQRNGA